LIIWLSRAVEAELVIAAVAAVPEDLELERDLV